MTEMKHTGASIYADPKAPYQELTADQRMILDALNETPLFRETSRVIAPMSSADENWAVMPVRLRGRGDFLLGRGQIKDAELMYDAATEIEGLRSRNAENSRFDVRTLEALKLAQRELRRLTFSDSAVTFALERISAAIAKATGA